MRIVYHADFQDPTLSGTTVSPNSEVRKAAKLVVLMNGITSNSVTSLPTIMKTHQLFHNFLG
jgi:hypothetical protein